MVRKDIKQFVKTIPSNIVLVAASKYATTQDIRGLFSSGISNFGENRVDAFLSKYNELSDLDIVWHFIGHLQRNKAKDVINKIDYLHSLDSLELAKIIDKQRKTPLNCFIEININNEDSKNGIKETEIFNFYKELEQYKNINVVGLMTMTVPSFSDEQKQDQFHHLYKIKNELENRFNKSIPYLSMGMSDDYLLAIKEGATHIRLGRILFLQE